MNLLLRIAFVDYLAPWPKSQGLFLGHQGLLKPHPGGCPALASRPGPRTAIGIVTTHPEGPRGFLQRASVPLLGPQELWMASVSPPERPLGHFPTKGETPHPTSRSGRHLRCSSPVSARHGQLKAPLSDRAKEPQLFRTENQLQDHLPGMMHDSAGYLDQLPPEGGEGVMSPGLRTGEALEAEEEMVGDHAEAEEDGIGKALPTGHPI